MKLGFKGTLAEKLVGWKTRKMRRRKMDGLRLPVSPRQVSRVLVILPHRADLLDAASEFVRELRAAYSAWQVEVFDADKLSGSEKNKLNLPQESVVKRIAGGNFNLVIDLHTQFDLSSAYLSLMTGAAYRIHCQEEDNYFYNIRLSRCHSANFDGLLRRLRELFPG